MDAEDLNRRIVGLLTLAYDALPQLERSDLDEAAFAAEFGRTVGSLMDGWGSSYNLDIELPPERAAELQAALQRLSQEISGDVKVVFGLFTGLFVRLCQEVEEQYPEADIPALLRKIGLEAAGGD